MAGSGRRRWRSLAWLAGIALLGAVLAVLAARLPLARAPTGDDAREPLALHGGML